VRASCGRRHTLLQPTGDIAMAGPMKAPSPHQVLLDPCGRNRIERVAGGDGGVEARLKRCHQRHAGQPGGHRSHRVDVGWIVGWSDFGHFLHRCQHLGCHAGDTPSPSAMHRLEAHRGHLGNIPEWTARPCELPKSRLKGDAMVGHGLNRFEHRLAR
jgi:hypothetical protein